VTAKTDLHIHTTISDGRFSPQEIVEKSARLGLGTIAICDHDNTNGIPPALATASAFPHLKVIPGVEISTYAPGSEVHILGYFMDFENPKLRNTLADSRNSRLERAKEMIAKIEYKYQLAAGPAGCRRQYHRPPPYCTGNAGYGLYKDFQRGI